MTTGFEVEGGGAAGRSRGRRFASFLARTPRWAIIGLIRGYQLVLSPLSGPTCRFYPSCSAYAVIALERHGVFRGGWLAIRRLARCHPWNPGGVDDVPAKRERRAAGATSATN